MRLLFIKLKHIGDALLLTPTLRAARRTYPSSEIWVVVRKGTEGILAGCDAIDRVCTAAAVEPGRRGRMDWLAGLRLILRLRKQHFDYAFELGDGDRGRGLAVMSGARTRCANGRVAKFPAPWRKRFNRISEFDWLMRHQVEKDFFTVNEALRLQGEPGALEFAAADDPGPLAAGDRYVVIHPATRWQRKRWPTEKWVRLCHELRREFGAIVVSCGPDAEEREVAQEITRAAGPGVVSTEGKLSWKQLATVLHQAQLFVGVDTAAMHLAAAAGTRIVALFGPSNEFQWAPWKAPHRIVLPPEPVLRADDPAFLGKLEQRKTAAIRVEDVVSAARELAGPGEERVVA